jgi:hypothetical protein
VEREFDSQPGDRCSAARGLWWPTPAPNSRPARGVTGRSRVCSTFTSVAEVHERCLARSRSSWSRPRRNEGPSPSEETRPGRTALTHGWKALWVFERRYRSCGPAGNDPKWSVKGKLGSRVESEQNTASHANTRDPKRVKRHETRHSPAPAGESPRDRKATWSSGTRSLKSGLFA